MTLCCPQDKVTKPWPRMSSDCPQQGPHLPFFSLVPDLWQAHHIHVPSLVQPIKPREMGREEESDQSTELPLASCRFLGRVMSVCQRPQLPSQFSPYPACSGPFRLHGGPATSLRMLQHPSSLLLSPSTLCVKFLTLFLNHSGKRAIFVLLGPCLINKHCLQGPIWSSLAGLAPAPYVPTSPH